MPFNRADAVKFADKHWNIPADDGIFWLSNQGVSIAQVREKNVIGTPYWKKAPAADGWQPFFVDDGAGGEKAVFRRVVGGNTEEILINPWRESPIALTSYPDASRPAAPESRSAACPPW
jgi:hypothetical protein